MRETTIIEERFKSSRLCSKHCYKIFEHKAYKYDTYINKIGVFCISPIMFYEANIYDLPSISLQLDGEFDKKEKIF